MMLLQEHDLQWGGQQGDPCPDFFMYAGVSDDALTGARSAVGWPARRSMPGFLYVCRISSQTRHVQGGQREGLLIHGKVASRRFGHRTIPVVRCSSVSFPFSFPCLCPTN